MNVQGRLWTESAKSTLWKSRQSVSLIVFLGLMTCLLATLWTAGCSGGGSSTPLPPPNPVPSLAPGSLNPSSATAGGAAFALTITGSNFVPSSVVQWNGTPRTTTYVSSTSLQATITAGDIANGGMASITVVTPAPGGGTSAALEYDYTIQAFDQKNYTPVSSISIENLLGTPKQLVRWGVSGLAVLTMNYGGTGSQGMLYIIQDSSFVSNAQPAASPTAKPAEMVKLRWKPITTADIIKMIHARGPDQLP